MCRDGPCRAGGEHALALSGRALITYSVGRPPVLFVATLFLAAAFGGVGGTAAREPGGNNGTLKIPAGTGYGSPPDTDRNTDP